MARHGVAGYWWASVPEEEWPQDAENRHLIASNWDARTGDARQEIVLIGMEMDQSKLIEQFDACLLTDTEMDAGPDAWQATDSPFMSWHELIA